MTTLLFVHGIGGREPVYTEILQQIQCSLHTRRPDITVLPCSWGETLGATLHAHGASIPSYETTRGTIDVLIEEDYEIALWEQLYKDPFYELRLLSLRSTETIGFVPGQEKLGDDLDERVRALKPSESLQNALSEAGVAETFAGASQIVVNSLPYDELLNTNPPSESAFLAPIGRALVAQCIENCVKQEIYAPLLTDAFLRDKLVRLLTNELGESERGMDSWLLKQLTGLAMNVGVGRYMQKRRGVLTDVTTPFAGDVLLYQGNGEAIREFIGNCIQIAEPPVVLLAHSLGGVACVDVLAQKLFTGVELLITVGSQAPFFYEIDALHSLRYTSQLEQRLPDFFPPWINLYDQRDFLSYIGATLFPQRVEDILVDNRQPFPQSHSAYWSNKSVWNSILSRLP